MSLILSWVLFPLVLAVVGAGWGFLAERAAGTQVHGALLLPLGLAAALVVAGTLNAFDSTAPATVPVVAAGAVVGLPLAWAGRRRLDGWALLAAAGVLLVYGAPVLFSGQATFTGFIRLDDTAYWLNVIDHLSTGPHAPAGELPSAYSLEYEVGLGPHYPRGAFMLPGVGRALSGVDMAWVFQPYLACCAAGVALSLYALIRPLVSSARVRALVAFLAAQSALLYGYSLWGGIKELTAAFMLALTVALAAALLPNRPPRLRRLIPVALAAGAMIQTIGVGAIAWVAPIVGLIAVVWLLQEWGRKRVLESAASIARLAALIAAFIVPVWISLSSFLGGDSGLFSSGQSEHVKLGNLIQPLSGFQLAGIWPVGDFRIVATGLPTVLLIGLVFLAAAGALWLSFRRRELGLLLYVAVALGASALIFLVGATPWVVGKTLAISSPALLVAGLSGAAMLWRRRRAGVLLLAALAFGVLWSSALAYHDVLLAPRPRLAELQHIGQRLAGKAPTLLNANDIYGTEHFLRAGAPVGPAEYRPVSLALSDGTSLTYPAWADLDSFPLSTIEEYPSIVTRHSPNESRPPSNYALVWQGRYYDLWQRSESTGRIIEHVPLGESTTLPFCGSAANASSRPECSVDPAAIPSCARIKKLARRAEGLNANLVAYQRAEPIVARADQSQWPASWAYDSEGHTLTARSPGELTSEINVATAQSYELWLGGSFARGFEVSVDGRKVGKVKNELGSNGSFVHVADVFLAPGTHTFALTYPHSDLSPGSGDNWFTSLDAIALQPSKPPNALIAVPPSEAKRLCGRSLDWIEIVARSG